MSTVEAHDDRPEIISQRAAELAQLAQHNAQELRRNAKRWRLLGVAFSLGAAGLAATAGATGLSDVLSKEFIAYLAIGAAVVTAINSGLGATSTAEAEQKAALDFFELETSTNNWRELRLPDESVDSASEKLESLIKQLNEALGLTAAAAYYLAKRDKRALEPGPHD